MIVMTTMKGKNKSEEVNRNSKKPLQVGGSWMSLEGLASALNHLG